MKCAMSVGWLVYLFKQWVVGIFCVGDIVELWVVAPEDIQVVVFHHHSVTTSWKQETWKHTDNHKIKYQYLRFGNLSFHDKYVYIKFSVNGGQKNSSYRQQNGGHIFFFAFLSQIIRFENKTLNQQVCYCLYRYTSCIGHQKAWLHPVYICRQ